jgi:hypothetical protein
MRYQFKENGGMDCTQQSIDLSGTTVRSFCFPNHCRDEPIKQTQHYSLYTN